MLTFLRNEKIAPSNFQKWHSYQQKKSCWVIISYMLSYPIHLQISMFAYVLLVHANFDIINKL